MAYPISDVTRRVVYTGSAGVGAYSFSFEILANTDIAVYKDSTLLTLTTDYSSHHQQQWYWFSHFGHCCHISKQHHVGWR